MHECGFAFYQTITYLLALQAPRPNRLSLAKHGGNLFFFLIFLLCQYQNNNTVS